MLFIFIGSLEMLSTNNLFKSFFFKRLVKIIYSKGSFEMTSANNPKVHFKCLVQIINPKGSLEMTKANNLKAHLK